LEPRGENGTIGDTREECSILVEALSCGMEDLRGAGLEINEPEGINILPGFREYEIGESSIEAVLDTLIPSYKEVLSPIPIPTYQGRNVYRKLEPGGVLGCSKKTGVGLGKDFTWLKGLGFEISPLKTWSARKKTDSTSSILEVHLTNLSDNEVLRGMKALARAKSRSCSS